MFWPIMLHLYSRTMDGLKHGPSLLKVRRIHAMQSPVYLKPQFDIHAHDRLPSKPLMKDPLYFALSGINSSQAQTRCQEAHDENRNKTEAMPSIWTLEWIKGMLERNNYTILHGSSSLNIQSYSPVYMSITPVLWPVCTQHVVEMCEARLLGLVCFQHWLIKTVEWQLWQEWL